MFVEVIINFSAHIPHTVFASIPRFTSTTLGKSCGPVPSRPFVHSPPLWGLHNQKKIGTVREGGQGGLSANILNTNKTTRNRPPSLPLWWFKIRTLVSYLGECLFVTHNWPTPLNIPWCMVSSPPRYGSKYPFDMLVRGSRPPPPQTSKAVVGWRKGLWLWPGPLLVKAGDGNLRGKRERSIATSLYARQKNTTNNAGHIWNIFIFCCALLPFPIPKIWLSNIWFAFL